MPFTIETMMPIRDILLQLLLVDMVNILLQHHSLSSLLDKLHINMVPGGPDMTVECINPTKTLIQWKVNITPVHLGNNIPIIHRHIMRPPNISRPCTHNELLLN